MKRKVILFLLSVTVIGMGGLCTCNEESNVNAACNRESKSESRTFLKYKDINSTNENMKMDVRDFTGQWSFLELNLKQGNNIVIEDNSEKSNGELFMVVLDNNYNIVDKKEVNGQGDLSFSAEEDGKYLVRIEGRNANGCLDIKVDDADKYDCEFKGKFDDRGSIYCSTEKWN